MEDVSENLLDKLDDQTITDHSELDRDNGHDPTVYDDKELPSNPQLKLLEIFKKVHSFKMQFFHIFFHYILV